MSNTPTLQTERLILRKFTVQDVSALYAILSNFEVNRFLPMIPPSSLEEAESYLKEMYLDTYTNPKGYRYAICFQSDNIPIGYVHVGTTEAKDFGYALLPQHWNQGIVTEASIAVIRQLFKDRVKFITATHDINNPASGSVMKKLGLVYKYSYVEQWMPKNITVTFRMYQLNLDGDVLRTYQEYWEKYPNHFIEESDSI
ncbi:GNAT family N-acetyltransferase [Erysipelothrix sp. HDW6C]|uniref:GNAT family N-acetyltransferase n=1 Tax=Erysipelothrix sp. HDW6C TaxID=2714930 RepID=UPI00140DE7F8|nr:GNAT family N-acetyltransferase [Erysipelothrix sp. HDW6C]QIK69115.1 GNAT family N-acetyltransferase [Erysipelothrix sp. HDW6C]